MRQPKKVGSNRLTIQMAMPAHNPTTRPLRLARGPCSTANVPGRNCKPADKGQDGQIRQVLPILQQAIKHIAACNNERHQYAA